MPTGNCTVGSAYVWGPRVLLCVRPPNHCGHLQRGVGHDVGPLLGAPTLSSDLDIVEFAEYVERIRVHHCLLVSGESSLQGF